MVFVLDKHKKPLMPCTEKRARLLLQRGRAVVHRMAPFTIRLKDRVVEECAVQPLRLKLDPGSRTTGFAVLRESSPDVGVAIVLGELHHKQGIKSKLDARRAVRRGRRNRKTRYRQPRFDNRRRSEGWLAPSLNARVQQTLNAVAKLSHLVPLSAISMELVKFDTQKLQNPEIVGIEYQQGELAGYEVREYLLEKWGRRCAYCGAQNVPLEVEHIIPKSRGGTDRVSNLTLACRKCNQAKGSKTAIEFGHPEVQEQAKLPLRDTAMVNATRWALYSHLQAFGLPIECGSGGRTKMQRIQHELPKEHYYDALCVGASTPATFTSLPEYIQVWSAIGRGTRKMCNIDKHGFPRGHRSSRKSHFSFQTGDLVAASVPGGKYAGRWFGRVAVRANGYFDIKDASGRRVCQGISYRSFRLMQRADGWQYSQHQRKEGTEGALSSPAAKAA